MPTPITPEVKQNGQSSRKQWIFVLIVWIACVAIFFAPVFMQNKVLAPLDILDSLLKPWATTEAINVHNAFPYDAISQYLPYNWSVYQSIRQDGYIGWNPYANNGTAILENTMLCPGDWHHQLYRWLLFWDAWDVGIILQFAIAGLGMLWLLRSQKIPPAYALAGIIAYGFYSQFITWYCHRWILGSMCWAPWMIWAGLRALQHNKKVDFWLCVFTALAFRGGHLQTCLFVVITTAIVFLPKLFSNLRKGASIVPPTALLVSTALFSSVLSLDVLMETIPAYFNGCAPRNYIGWLDSIKTLPAYGTLLFPLAFGTPDGLNVLNVFGSDLLELTFLGSTVCILGTLALFRKEAPSTAKVLFIVGLVLPLTPASTWLYHRCTPIFALGCAWLAVWMLATLKDEPRHTKLLKALITVYIAVTVLWLLASVAIQLTQSQLLDFLFPKILAQLPANKIDRSAWMLERTATFLSRSKIWHPETLTMHLLLLAGLVTLTKIHDGTRHVQRYAYILALVAFCELFLYSRTWITFSERPLNENDLYNTPTWVATLKKDAGNGAIAVNSGKAFDYFQLNTASTHGIRFQGGYETVPPLRCTPLTPDAFDPEDYAQSGVSLYLTNPDLTPTNAIVAGWILVHDSPDFNLYRNPAFTSRILAVTETAPNPTPIFLTTETANTRTFTVPVGTRSVMIGETYNKGWSAFVNDTQLSLLKNERNGIDVFFRDPTRKPTQVTLRYSIYHRQVYEIATGFSLMILLLLSFIQHRNGSPKLK